MKKMTTLFFLLIGGSLLSFFLLLAGCQKARDTFFIFKKVNITINNDSTISDNPLPAKPVAFDSFFLAMQLEQVETGATTNIQLPGNQAYAFTFQDPYTYRNADPIKSVHLITLYDYNDRYPAGSDVSAICSYSSSYQETISPESLIERLNTFAQRDDQFYERSNFYDYKIYFSEPPATEQKQQFAIVLLSEQNTRLMDTTNVFILKP